MLSAFYYFMDKVIQYIAFYSMNIPFFACHFYCEDVCCFHHLAVTNKAEPINFRIFTESVSESVDNIIIYSGVLSYAIFFKIIALLRYNSSNWSMQLSCFLVYSQARPIIATVSFRTFHHWKGNSVQSLPSFPQHPPHSIPRQLQISFLCL